eukprot:COSAG01_NODE_4297_length_5164_cov_5.625469_3_plen_985_part_00
MSEHIVLLDCSVQQSSEYKGGNTTTPALYTNKMGDGIKVNAGDTVSIHQAYISETGSDDNAIQITNDLLERRSLTYTQITKHNLISGSNSKVMGYERVTASNTSEEKEIFTNKTSLLYNYYITNNGENTFGLPRRFVYSSALLNTDWNTSHDSVALGRPYNNSALITETGSTFNYDQLSMFYCDDDYYWFEYVDVNSSQVNILRPVMNNKRMRIFIQTETRYGNQTDTTLPDIVNGSLTSPAQLDYIEYIEKLDIDIDTGFKSPESVASLITNKLRKQSQPEIQTIESIATYKAINILQYRSATVEINSPTYHTFYAGSTTTLNEAYYDEWESSTTDDDRSLLYLAGHQHIGVKRPELFIKGREFLSYYKDLLNSRVAGAVPNISYACLAIETNMNASMFDMDAPVSNDPSSTDYNNHTIILGELWNNKEYMRKLKDVFIEQGKHPELFENKYNQYRGFTTENNSRFLHMNIVNDTQRKSVDNTLERQLGTDYLKDYENGVPNLQSVPVFVDFNPAYENIETEGDSWESGYSYGIFKKHIDSLGLEVISVTTSKLGFLDDSTLSASFTSIPNPYFMLNDGGTNGSNIKRKTQIGVDSHFMAYGNVCYGILSGWNRNPPDTNSFNYQLPTAYTTDELETYLFQQKLYMGANEPLLEYNTTSNKFEFSQLHTSERIQNRFNAGSTNVEEFATAGDKVYKINKRIFSNNYTPDMIPYGANSETGLTIGGNPYDIDFLNPSFSKWTIFDQLSGIIIRDFGYSETQWNNGIWGILGFDYNQFNASSTSLNDQTTRVGNDNKDLLPYAMTNAEVDQLATMDLATNIWGAGIYNLQLPSTMSFNVTSIVDYFRKGMKYEQYVAITKPASSIKLSAPRLPRKLISPYFCIRSDVLDDSQYIGGQDSGQLFPVIATIPKSNDYGDYFVSLDSPLDFVFTRPKIISSITTSIHNPDQSLAEVDPYSSVIYKITKQLNPNRFNIVSQILDENKKK